MILSIVLYGPPTLLALLLTVLILSEWFRKWFFAKVFTSDFFMGWVKKLFKDHRKEFLKDFSQLKTDPNNKLTVLEVGAGDGANFGFYPKNTTLIALDYNDNFKNHFHNNLKNFPHIELKRYITGDVQNMSEIADESVDVVLMTHVLCSVPDVSQGLKEVKRVLRKNGKFFFFEHVGYKDHTSIGQCACALVQKALTPLWKVMMGGCRLDNSHWEAFERSGFARMDFRVVYPNNIPFLFRSQLTGFAQK